MVISNAWMTFIVVAVFAVMFAIELARPNHLPRPKRRSWKGEIHE